MLSQAQNDQEEPVRRKALYVIFSQHSDQLMGSYNNMKYRNHTYHLKNLRIVFAVKLRCTKEFLAHGRTSVHSHRDQKSHPREHL
jgi:hypothetical protein